MRPEILVQHVEVGSSGELDALVADRVMGESPSIFWEDSYANQRFESLEEALESMKDPYFQRFIPEGARAEAVLAEVREFPPYSTKIGRALEVVEHFGEAGEALRLLQKDHWWFASFGGHIETRGRTAAAAICLAGLRAKGLIVRVRDDFQALR